MKFQLIAACFEDEIIFIMSLMKRCVCGEENGRDLI